MKRNSKKETYLTLKGLTLIVAIESGLLPEVEGGWDDTKFQIFWNKYESELKKYKEVCNDF